VDEYNRDIYALQHNIQHHGMITVNSGQIVVALLSGNARTNFLPRLPFCPRRGCWPAVRDILVTGLIKIMKMLPSMLPSASAPISVHQINLFASISNPDEEEELIQCLDMDYITYDIASVNLYKECTCCIRTTT